MDDTEQEQRLWRAVLLQTINDLIGPKPSPNSNRELVWRDAKDWLMAADREIGTFVWAAESLGLDANFVRARILKHVGQGAVKNRCFRAGTSAVKRPSRVHRPRNDVLSGRFKVPAIALDLPAAAS
jgi:hypothetical protein